MGAVVETALSAEKLGIVGVLIAVIIVAAWVIRTLYKQGGECERARLEDAQERAKMNLAIGELKGEVTAMRSLHLHTRPSVNGTQIERS